MSSSFFLLLVDFHDGRVVFQQGLRLTRAREFDHERVAIDLEHLAATERFMVDRIAGRERIVRRLLPADAALAAADPPQPPSGIYVGTLPPRARLAPSDPAARVECGACELLRAAPP